MKTKLKKLLTLFVASSFISSCMVLKKYENPSAPNAATLTIITFAINRMNMAVWHYPGEEYLDTKGKSIGKLNPTAIGERKTNKFVVKAIPNIEFRFAISSALQELIVGEETLKTTLCKPHVGFIPKPNKIYVAEHHVFPGKCAIKIFEVAQNTKKPEPTQRYYRSCLDSFSVSPALFPKLHCKKGFQFRNKSPNKTLQLIHKSGAPIVAPLFLSTELNRYI